MTPNSKASLKKYGTFLASGLPSWVVGLYISYLLKDALPFWTLALIFHFITIHINFFIAKIIVFTSNERGSRYLSFVQYIVIYRISEYGLSLIIYEISSYELLSILLANGLISVVKYKALNKTIV